MDSKDGVVQPVMPRLDAVCPRPVNDADRGARRASRRVRIWLRVAPRAERIGQKTRRILGGDAMVEGQGAADLVGTSALLHQAPHECGAGIERIEPFGYRI